MDIDMREEQGCLVARPRRDSLDYGVSAAFRDAVLERLLAGQPRGLVIDLQDVSFLDSMALGALVSLHRLGRREGGSVALSGLTPFVAKVLDVAAVDSLFFICEDVPQALACVASDAAGPTCAPGRG